MSMGRAQVGFKTVRVSGTRRCLVAAAWVMAATGFGCGGGGDTKMVGRGSGGASSSASGTDGEKAASGSLSATAEPSSAIDSISATGVATDDFIERDTNRDPFRSFVDIFTPKLTGGPQRAVVMPTASIDEMRLIAIVLGDNDGGRAMVVDGGGVGYTLRRGDYLGRPEVVQVGGAEGVPVTLNWRVDRIRENELVISRDDPTSPERPPLVRVIPLHDEREEAALAATRPAN
jgi:type IV pilus assembly protein PilP